MAKDKQKQSKAGLREQRKKLTNDIFKAAMGVRAIKTLNKGRP